MKKKLLELLDDDSDVRERGKHIGQEEWNDILDNDSSALVLDIRNSVVYCLLKTRTTKELETLVSHVLETLD